MIYYISNNRKQIGSCNYIDEAMNIGRAAISVSKFVEIEAYTEGTDGTGKLKYTLRLTKSDNKWRLNEYTCCSYYIWTLSTSR